MTANKAIQQRVKQRKAGMSEEDLARKYMSKEDVLKEKAEKKKKAAYLAEKSKEYDAKDGKVETPAVKTTKELLSEEQEKKLAKLKKEKSNLSGPGSKARKEAIDKAIANLENKDS